MDKELRDELLDLAHATRSERWCLHPNGTSVWTGEEYTGELVADQHPVCNAVLPLDEIDVRRMEFIAGCNPHVLIELLEFYGLSDTRIERGYEDSDEVCAACGISTSEGHTHFECYTHGRSAGSLDENIDCSNSLAEALGVDHQGHFEDTLKKAALLREDAQILAELVEPVGLTERQMQALLRAQGVPVE